MSPRTHRVATVMVWAILAALVGFGGTSSAETPLPAHTFVGTSATALLNGQPAPDGTVVSARNESDVVVAETAITLGIWQLAVAPAAAETVTFYLAGEVASAAQVVVPNELTELQLAAGVPPPPQPAPHQFYGDAGSGTGATIDGVLAPDGSVVRVRNGDGVVVAETTINNGLWLVRVDPAAAATVTFSLAGEVASVAQAVVPGELTALQLAVGGPPLPPPPPQVAPHQFYGDAGSGTGATIDGAPAPDGTVVRARNEAGVLVAETMISEGLWLVRVDPEVAATVTFDLDFRVASATHTVEAGALSAIVLHAELPHTEGPPVSLTFTRGTASGETGEWTATLPTGFTAVTYHGAPLDMLDLYATRTPVADAFIGVAGLAAVYAWNGAEFLVWRPDGPAFANTLTTVSPGDALFVRVEGDSAAWLQGRAITTAESVPLTTGLNFVSWTGPELLPVAEAVSGIAEVVEAVFLWDPATASYLTYRPGAPDLLNTLDALPYGAGVWVAVSAGGVWAQPARDG